MGCNPSFTKGMERSRQAKLIPELPASEAGWQEVDWKASKVTYLIREKLTRLVHQSACLPTK
jgi:hypothetical protein